jgi:FKBP-type peptidyl-prolyl cis-trans isomerase SlyD
LSEETVTADFNHALAGKELTFSVEVIEIRMASEDEAAHGHIHPPEQAKNEGKSGGCNNDGCC